MTIIQKGEPMSDLIDRQAAIEALHDEIVRRRISEDTNDNGTLDEFDTEAILRQLPPAQPEQRIGKWIRNGWAITCSECGYDMPYTVRNFCPNCGAKMTKGVAE